MWSPVSLLMANTYGSMPAPTKLVTHGKVSRKESTKIDKATQANTTAQHVAIELHTKDNDNEPQTELEETENTKTRCKQI